MYLQLVILLTSLAVLVVVSDLNETSMFGANLVEAAK